MLVDNGLLQMTEPGELTRTQERERAVMGMAGGYEPDSPKAQKNYVQEQKEMVFKEAHAPLANQAPEKSRTVDTEESFVMKPTPSPSASPTASGDATKKQKLVENHYTGEKSTPLKTHGEDAEPEWMKLMTDEERAKYANAKKIEEKQELENKAK